MFPQHRINGNVILKRRNASLMAKHVVAKIYRSREEKEEEAVSHVGVPSVMDSWHERAGPRS